MNKLNDVSCLELLCIRLLGETRCIQPSLLLQYQGFRDTFERNIRLFRKYQGEPMYVRNPEVESSFCKHQRGIDNSVYVDSLHRKVIRWISEDLYTMEHGQLSVWIVYIEIPFFHDHAEVTEVFRSQLQLAGLINTICQSWISKYTGNVVVSFMNNRGLRKPFEYDTKPVAGLGQLLLASELYVKHWSRNRQQQNT